VPLSPIVSYDPVLRTVRVSSPNPQGGAWLLQDQPYEIVLGVPSDAGEQFTLRAIDGAPLDTGILSRRQFAFLTKAPNLQARRTPMDFCRDVFPTFAKYCGDCHSAGQAQAPAAALLLDTGEGVWRTTVGQIAKGANTGGRAGNPGPPPAVFGVDMALVDPGSPGTSWLLYKMMMQGERHPLGWTCAGYRPPAQLVTQGSIASDLDDAERVRLSNLMTGQAMPPPGSVSTPSLDELERVSEWIAQGARTDVCSGGCARPVGGDAGP